MARTEGLLIEQIGDETVAYDLESREAHCLKPLAAVVFAYADGRNTAADLAELASYRMGTTVTEAEVRDAVAQLQQRGLLDVPLVAGDGLSRREAVQRLATVAGVAAATPLIATVMAPTAAMAATNIPTGQCCGSTKTTCTGLNPTCASNHCCQNLSSKDCNQCKCVGNKNDCSTAQCSAAPTGCPNITVIINGVPTVLTPCAKTPGGKCCYTDTNGNCCTVITSGNVDVQC